MPQYYSLGKLTLCIGRFIESFGGNSSIESILCGTPVILSRVGAQRTTLPEEVIDKVDVGDIESIKRISIRILEKDRDLSAAQEFIKKNYNFKRMLESYEDVMLNAKPLSRIPFVFAEKKKNSKIRLAPWCYLAKNNKVYSDYLYSYVSISKSIDSLLKKEKVYIGES